MTTIQALILGVVQGITEFLPISSSGHLVLIQKLWGMEGDPLEFIIIVHLATLFAVWFAFRKEVNWLIRNPLSRFGITIWIALVPTILIGAVCEELFEDVFSNAGTLGLEFVMTGVILWWMDSLPVGHKLDRDIRVRDALWVGTLQGIAILPALSRSGLTIAGGLWRGMSKETAARFSFLLSIPAILGATLVKLDDLIEEPTSSPGHISWCALLIGFGAALIAGYLGVRFTMDLLKKGRMRIFAVYVWILAAFVLSDQLFYHHWFPSLF
jgi:undecaprenyl-diphosphatase